jgi:carbonic anhydrase/acetyltransferase-like protein (isoleucine patch superfamily)
MQDYINCNKRPLIFLGSNIVMNQLKEICEDYDIQIHGIIDNDYHSSGKEFCGIPVIDTEKSFQDPDRLDFYRTNFNFFCATNWIPEKNPVQERNREKRNNLIGLLDQYQLPVISLIDNKANVSKYATIGRGVFIDAICNIEPDVVIDDYVWIGWASGIGHGTRIERNCVIQRQVWTGGFCHFEPECFVGIGAKTLKTKARFGKGTWIQEMVYIKRGTVPGEIVGLEGTNTRRIVVPPSID